MKILFIPLKTPDLLPQSRNSEFARGFQMLLYTVKNVFYTFVPFFGFVCIGWHIYCISYIVYIVLRLSFSLGI